MEQSKFYQIKNITEHEYTLVGCDGSVITRPIQDVDKSASAFTIQDAKDGDVLYSPCLKLLWIFKSIDTVHCGCNLNYNDGAFCGDGYIEIPTDAIPATKEQRDLLFQKMKEAGYEWDAEKKELKKIEQKPITIDIDKMVSKYSHTKDGDFGLPVNCQIRAYRQGINDALNLSLGIKKQGEQKSAWSEEDDDDAWMNDIISKVENNLQLNKAEIDWLKSFKGRVQPQTKEWTEDDKNHMANILTILSIEAKNAKVEQYRSSVESDIDWIYSLKNKDRVQPKQEWSEKDVRNIENIDSILFYDKDLPEETCIRLRNWLKSLKERIKQ